MKVVSNASPLINLARVGQLTLLQQLYGQITHHPPFAYSPVRSFADYRSVHVPS